MKVELIVSDDRQLREAINELIRGQVLSIARKDIKDILAEVIKVKTDNLTKEQYVEKILKSEIRKAVDDVARPSYGKNIVRALLEEEVIRIVGQELGRLTKGIKL